MASLRDLLTTIATKIDPQVKIGSGVNFVPNRFHLDHPDGELIDALKTVATQAPALLAELPADAPVKNKKA